MLRTSKFLVDTKTYNERLKICKKCPHYFKLTGNCKLCGCYMKVKAGISALSCPDNRWLKTSGENTIQNKIPDHLAEEVKAVWQEIKNEKFENQETKKRGIELYNTIYNANYGSGTNCSSCLNAIYRGIKDAWKYVVNNE